MAASNIEIPNENLTLYDTLIGKHIEMERKGKTTPYTSVNGHMFSFLSKNGTMGLRLSKSDLESFIKKYKVNLMEQHGRTMKEYVEVPFELLKNTEELSKFLIKSYTYISGLKPKITKKKATK